MLPTLYKTSKSGKVQVWKTWTEGNIVVSEFGFLEGTIQREERAVLEGTNIGKKNERTCDDQAEFIAKSNWDAHVNYKGYVTDLKKEKKAGLIRKPKGGINLQKCEYYSSKLMMAMGFPLYVQPKLDGVGTGAEIDFLSSSGGAEYKGFPLIYGDLRKLLKSNDAVNGELYLHGMPLNEISGIARKAKDIDYTKKNQLELWLYDAPQIGDYTKNDPFYLRFKVLADRIKSMGLERIRLVPTFKVHTEAQIYQKHNDFVADFYEGAIIRKPDMAFYQSKTPSDRSKEILKLKNFQDAEFPILYPIEGEGRDAGTAGSFLLQAENGKTFKCRPKGTYEYRRQLLNNPEMWQGHKMTVRYLQMWDGVPQTPVGHHIRPEGE